MKYLNTIVLFAILAITFNSCNFLNVSDNFDETLKYDSIFHTKRNIERYLWGTAAYLPKEGAIFGNNHTPGPFATDEGFCLYGTGEFRGMAYVLDEVTASNQVGLDNWATLYQIIRKVNTILNRMDEAIDLTTFDKREILGYSYFLRAYAYYHILMKYGPVVLIGDDIMETNEDPGYYDRHRATYDESVEYICSEMEKAAEYMPAEVPVSFFGRPTQGAVYGIIARLRLIHASPLFNGGAAARTYYGDWTRTTDGVHYVSQTYDEKRWAIAALAAKRIIKSEKYWLYTIPRMTDTYPLPANVSNANFPDGAGNIDPYRSYANMFNGEALAARNPEYLWGYNSSEVLSYTKHSFPVIQMGGWNGLGVTQKVVDNFLMADGKTINNSSTEYPYSMEGTLGGSGKTFSEYQLKSSVSNMYINREMRFYATIGFSECFWPANSTSSGDKKSKIITYYSDGNSGKNQTDGNVNNYPITGYVLKKYIHPDDAWDGDNAQRLSKSFPIIRYAEILLSYAEALNNLTTTHTITDEAGEVHTISRDASEIKRYFDEVRYRAGLPGIEVGSIDEVQELVERERMIEFLFEDRRYFDVRRWGKYEISEKEPLMGMNIEAPKASYYSIVPVNHSKARNRLVDKKLVFLPISLSEIRKASKLDQNPGWQK